MRTIMAKEKDFEATATVVIESTGHYHKILKRALDLHGIRVVVKDKVLKRLAKASRKGMTWAQTKLDTILVKDRTIAKLGANEAVFADLIRSEIVLCQALNQQMTARLERVKDYLQKNARSDNPKLALQVALLQTIPGVGLISALTIVAECGDISRFKHARALTAFAGLDPSVKESGQFKGTRNKVSKRGNRQLRQALYMVAMRSVSINRKGDYVNPYLRDFYDRKCQSKPNKVALIAVAHKLIFIIFAVLRDQKPFYWVDPEEHQVRINSA
jgi:transposase